MWPHADAKEAGTYSCRWLSHFPVTTQWLRWGTMNFIGQFAVSVTHSRSEIQLINATSIMLIHTLPPNEDTMVDCKMQKAPSHPVILDYRNCPKQEKDTHHFHVCHSSHPFFLCLLRNYRAQTKTHITRPRLDDDGESSTAVHWY